MDTFTATLKRIPILQHLLLISILFLAFLLRFMWLESVPSAISGDELTYILAAKSMFLTGKDMTQTWSPLSALLFSYHQGEIQAELPYLLLLPVVGFTHFSLFTARITYVCISVLLVLAIYLTTKELFEKRTALIAAALAAINPWLLFNGRTAYEMTLAMFLYTCSLYVLIKAKGWKILLALPVLLLAFYSYIATKVFFLPFVLLTVAYAYVVINKKRFTRQYLIICIFSLMLTAFFFLSLKLHPQNSRLSEVFTPNAPEITRQVNEIRKASIHTPFTSLFENKYTLYGKILANKLFVALSPEFLFVTGDEFFSVWRHGLFYAIDALFLITGIVFMFVKKKSLLLLLLSLSLTSLLPQILHTAATDVFSPHITLLFPFFIIIMAYGIWSIIDMVKTVRGRRATSAIIFVAYAIFLANFLNIYFYQYSLQGYFDFPMRVLSRYAVFANMNNIPVMVYSTHSEDLFRKYIFYSDSYNKETAQKIAHALAAHKYTLGSMRFLSCDRNVTPEKLTSTLLYDIDCGSNTDNPAHLHLPQLATGGEIYKVFNDRVCSAYNLKAYPAGISLNSFALEHLSQQQFCETFITR